MLRRIELFSFESKNSFVDFNQGRDGRIRERRAFELKTNYEMAKKEKREKNKKGEKSQNNVRKYNSY